MTPLRKKMIEAMRQRGFSVRTHQSYLSAVSQLAQFHRRSPEELDVREVQAFFAHLVSERELSGASCRLYLNGVRFLYLHVLEWSHFDVPITIPKKAQRIPELLTREEVGRILAACANPKHRMVLSTCYGCGLRVSEVVALQVRRIDGERRLLRIEAGQGGEGPHGDRVRDAAHAAAGVLAALPSGPVALSRTASRHPHRHLHRAARVPAREDARRHREGGWHSQPAPCVRDPSARGGAAGACPSAPARAPQHPLDAALPATWVPSYREGPGAHSDLVGSLEIGQ